MTVQTPLPPMLTVRMGRGFSIRIRRRSLTVSGVLVVVLAVLVALALTTGDFAVPLPDVVGSLLGTGDPGTDFIVRTLRLPRVLLAVMVGAALGASGSIFQSMTQNPLGSPDFIGFTAGAATGGIVAILLGSGEPMAIALAAIAGGLLTALAVYALAYRNGVQAFRLVLVGLGAGYTVYSINAYLLSRASLGDSLTAERWLVGSLNEADWTTTRALGSALIALVPFVVVLSRPLAAMEVGDDASTAFGVRTQLLRPLIVLIGVGLAALAVAAAGPIAFVALTAPQIGRRLTCAPGPNLAVSALMGAVVLAASDIVTQRILPQDLPVGLVTGVLGGAHLTWLLTGRRRSS